jgi:SHS2 domain-containing protein
MGKLRQRLMADGAGPEEPMATRWSHFEHGADIGIRGQGSTKEEAFEQAALALTGVLTNPRGVKNLESIRVWCSAPDDELLLLDWLNALIYEMAVRKMLFGHVEVRILDGCLEGTAWGEPVDVARHQPAVEVKGATCTGLRVAQTADHAWVAECVVDV